MPACATPVIACGASFATAQPRAIALVDAAITALNLPLSPKATAALTDLFGGPVDGPASAATVQAKLGLLKTHITAMSIAGRHQCHESACDAGCSSPAFNSGVDAASVMTMCTEFVNNPNLDERAYLLIHEGCHGTSGINAPVDISYLTERRIRVLSNAEALHNPDSYWLLVDVLTAALGVVVPIGFAGDTRVGMNAAEDRAAANALAHAEKWLIMAFQDVGFAYNLVNESVPVGSWAPIKTAVFDKQTLHLLAGRFAGITDPDAAAAPTADDRIKLAALHDRYETMFRTMYGTGITTPWSLVLLSPGRPARATQFK